MTNLISLSSIMIYIQPEALSLNQKSFTDCLHKSDTYSGGTIARQQYIDASIPRLYRIFGNMLKSHRAVGFEGPTLDVASGWGIMFPAYNEFLDSVLPYYIAEMGGWTAVIDGVRIDGCGFECEKDLLSFEDSHFGLVCFFDCLEHLIVDPVWTLLGFNRVLRLGGHLAMSTPNALAAYRVMRLFRGENPATESEMKPSSIYQRHNREWTPNELALVLECCGFGNCRYSTNDHLLSGDERRLLQLAQEHGFLTRPAFEFGPELFVVAEKVEHVTLDSNLPKERRWPEWLYTSFDAYRRRPLHFPIIVSDDYA
jgi:SAM-dependent methyltransferase